MESNATFLLFGNCEPGWCERPRAIQTQRSHARDASVIGVRRNAADPFGLSVTFVSLTNGRYVKPTAQTVSERDAGVNIRPLVRPRSAGRPI